MLGGLDYPTSGRVYLRNEDIFQLKEDDLAVMRRRKKSDLSFRPSISSLL